MKAKRKGGKATKRKATRVKTKRSARCRHDNWRSEYVPDLTSLRWTRCDDCRTLLPLGPSNDDSDAVRVEMRAAELEWMFVDSAMDNFDPIERTGWRCHAREAGVLANDTWHAGWLARELTSHGSLSRDIDAWPWDPTEPVAGQYEQLQQTLLEMDCLAAESCPAADHPLTVSIDSDGTPAAQINGLCDAPPMFSPDEAEALAEDLLLGADAARQAARDGYHGPAVVVELLVGEEPERGVEFELEEAHKAGADCPMMGCLEDGSAYDPDDLLSCAARGADLTSTEILDISDAVQRGEVVLPDPEGKP